MKCLGCGSYRGENLPQSIHCDDCPPWRCPDCGGWDSVAQACPCWIDLRGLPLADIKGLLAKGGLSVG